MLTSTSVILIDFGYRADTATIPALRQASNVAGNAHRRLEVNCETKLMTFSLLDIPVLFGVSIEVYFILIILGIPTFFIWSWIFKKYIRVDRTRKIWTWAATILLTPCIYVGLIMRWFFSVSYYPNHDFEKQKWVNDKVKQTYRFPSTKLAGS